MPTTRATGRPTKYSDKLATSICHKIAAGESLKAICDSKAMPARSTVMLWVAEDREGFSDRYARACDARAHLWADEILDIADNGANDWMERNDPNNPGFVMNGEAINRARLRVDSRKWLLSKLLTKYADKKEVDHRSSDGSMTPQVVERVIIDPSQTNH